MAGTKLTYVNFRGVGDDAARFRLRARECRERAERAYYVMRQFLLEIADGLDEEANAMDAEEIRPSSAPVQNRPV